MYGFVLNLLPALALLLAATLADDTPFIGWAEWLCVLAALALAPQKSFFERARDEMEQAA